MNLQPLLDRIPPAYGKWIGVAPGWYPIVVRLDAAIAALVPDYVLHQVKEKYGGLRYYCSCEGLPEVEALINAAEIEAYSTCETCGAAGAESGTVHGWVKTLCETCKLHRTAA